MGRKVDKGVDLRMRTTSDEMVGNLLLGKNGGMKNT